MMMVVRDPHEHILSTYCVPRPVLTASYAFSPYIPCSSQPHRFDALTLSPISQLRKHRGEDPTTNAGSTGIQTWTVRLWMLFFEPLPLPGHYWK